jgi:hypothetical protein
MMQTAIPRSWFSWDFSLMEGGTTLAEIDMSAWREKGVLTIAGKAYRVHRERLLSGAFVMELEGTILARATKPSMWSRRMVVESGGTQFTLRPRSSFSRTFRLYRDDVQVGMLAPAGCFTRRMEVELPQSLTLPLQVFVVWLTLLSWKREANSAASSG